MLDNRISHFVIVKMSIDDHSVTSDGHHGNVVTEDSRSFQGAAADVIRESAFLSGVLCNISTFKSHQNTWYDLPYVFI